MVSVPNKSSLFCSFKVSIGLEADKQSSRHLTGDAGVGPQDLIGGGTFLDLFERSCHYATCHYNPLPIPTDVR